MHVVLVHPDIPWNTGNVGRTCVAFDTPLHLIRPMGFSLEDRWLKRAGLDYWKHVDLSVHDSFAKFLKSDAGQLPIFFLSRFARKSLWDVRLPADSVLIFGSETKGLPASMMKRYKTRLVRIPTWGPVRSLNLSTAVGIALAEANRQNKRRMKNEPRR